MTCEVEWWSDVEERVIGAVVLDRTDNDWGWIILGRDEKSLFRGIDLEVSLETQVEARHRLGARLKNYAVSGEVEFPQHDTDKEKNKILEPKVPEHKLHRNFKILMGGEQHSPARAIIREIAYAFVDVDGNYTKDFQTTGFDARLWELFLFVFLYEQSFHILREFNRPDFCAIKFGYPIAIEAVTVNPTVGEAQSVPKNRAEIDSRVRDYMPLRFASALIAKLRKKYWELPHVKDVPFVIAIHDFHAGNSMTWSAPALDDYLYGVRASWTKDEQGKLHIIEHPINEHVWNGKRRQSGFFKLPDAEHVSAILFSNSATLSKFNRMAKLAGFGSKNVRMIRMGFRQNFDPNATEGTPFEEEVVPPMYTEDWSEGVRIFHNPWALKPIPDDLFEGCSQHFFENGRRRAKIPNDFVHSSETLVFAPKQ